MPFKTKKRKLHAAKNRISLGESGSLIYDKSPEATLYGSKEPSETLEPKGSIDENGHSKIRSELVRIFLLSSVIIGLQLALKASNLSIFR